MESSSESSDEFSESEFDSSDDSDSSSIDIASVRSWCKIDVKAPPIAPPRFPFQEVPGIAYSISDKEDPLEYFSKFFDEGVVELIVKQTNLFATQYFSSNTLTPKSRLINWVMTTKSEILLFISLLILEGIHQKPSEKMYWSKIPSIETPYFSKIMPEKRFSLIMKFLHFSDNEQYDNENGNREISKLIKIEDIMFMLMTNFENAYILERDISIDESLMLYKGRLGWKQYIPSKRARFGIKFFMLCESSSGYVSRFIIYTGKSTKFLEEYEGKGTGIKCVLTLLNPFLNKGYCVTMDNFYNSPELGEILISKKTDFYGTIKTNRKDLPEEIRNKKMKKGEIIGFQRGKIIALKWQDKRPVAVLSSVHSVNMKAVTKNGKNVEKPQAICDYNNTMGGVDRMDAAISNYAIIRKQKKYYKKIFRHLLDISVWNAFVLYKKNEGSLNHLHFRLKLIERLAEENISEVANHSNNARNISSAVRFQGNHFPALIPETLKKEKPTKRCYICCQKENENGKKIRKETRYFCKKCDIALCPAPCFEAYHTKV